MRIALQPATTNIQFESARRIILSAFTLSAYIFGATPALAQQQTTQPQSAQQQYSQPLQDNTTVSTGNLLTEGKNLFAAGNVQGALNVFRQFSQNSPNNFAGHFWVGFMLDQSGDSKGALAAYSKSLDLAKSVGMDSAELRINLGNSLGKLGYTKEPRFDYERAIIIDSLNPLAYLGLSKCLIDAGEFDGALQAIARYESLNGRDITVPLLRGLALAGQGSLSAAQQQLRSYLTLTGALSTMGQPVQNGSGGGTQLQQLAFKVLNEIELMQ